MFIPNDSNFQTAIVTIAVGEMHQRMLDITHPTIAYYANKVRSDLIVITSQSGENPKALKFTLYELLSHYQRLIYLDGDIAINPNCPNLFNLVPVGLIGATCESLPYFNRDQMMQELCAVYGIRYQDDKKYCFINSGMMVVSRIHKELFFKPNRIIPIQGFFDQPYINARIIQLGFQVKDLGLQFNHTGTFLLRGARPYGHGKAFMVHATGALQRYRLEYLKFVIKMWGYR